MVRKEFTVMTRYPVGWFQRGKVITGTTALLFCPTPLWSISYNLRSERSKARWNSCTEPGSKFSAHVSGGLTLFWTGLLSVPGTWLMATLIGNSHSLIRFSAPICWR
jgi:hypothetical protein